MNSDSVRGEGAIHREDLTDIASNGGRNTDGSPRMLSRWTFEYASGRAIAEEHIHGRFVNACAGKTGLSDYSSPVRLS